MTKREKIFRIAVRKYAPFESAIAKQWQAFESMYRTGLELRAIPLDLHELYETLFDKRGLIHGNCDVAFVNTDWLAEAAESKALVDLSSYLATSPPDGYPGAWCDSLLRLQRFGDFTLGLPYHDGPECLIYRKDLFDDPEERRRFAAEFASPLEVPQTWEQFHRIARFFTRPQSGLFGTAFAAFPDGHNTVYDFCLQLWTRGGELFDPNGHILLSTQQAQAALKYYRMVLNDSQAIHPSSRTFDSVQSGLAFAAGEIAMMVNWFGFAFLAQTSPGSKIAGRVGVAPVPADPGLSASLNVYWLLGIAEGSPHREIAWSFLRHCAGPEMDKLTTLEGAIGCRKSTWSDPEVNSQVPFYRELQRLHDGARELPRLREWSRLAEVIDRMVLDAIDTEDLVDEILRRAQKRAKHATFRENQQPLNSTSVDSNQ
jgi:multiple sugar transport system substrate-binding protein